MTSFVDFAREHGLVIQRLIEGRWARCRTVDRPRKWNGSYKYLGDVGFVQNHATMDQVAVWREERAYRTRPPDVHRLRRQSLELERKGQEAARDLAGKMLDSAVLAKHPYLANKGFPDERGFVLDRELLIPMRAYEHYSLLNGIQRITAEGQKRFLSGAKAKGSVFVIGHPRPQERWLVEGYATGLSLRTALAELRRDAQVVVCFSANNLAHVGALMKRRSVTAKVLADNDVSRTGIQAATDTGLPWCVPEEAGFDGNDLHQRLGLRALVGLIREVR